MVWRSLVPTEISSLALPLALELRQEWQAQADAVNMVTSSSCFGTVGIQLQTAGWNCTHSDHSYVPLHFSTIEVE